MTFETDHTHDASVQSWVTSANAPGTEFPIQNLPLGVFSTAGANARRIGVAIGDQILDLSAALDKGLLPGLDGLSAALRSDSLNLLMSSGRAARQAVRDAVFTLLRADSGQAAAGACLVAMRDARLHLPAQIGDFTDFFTSIHHARRTGEIIRPEMPIAPNFRHMPIAYHGRASTVVESGVPCIRPRGQLGDPQGAAAEYAPTKRLDFELEVGFYIGRENSRGQPIPIDDADDHMFGLCLVNDWSARDIQMWEGFPLGPFLSKSFMTTASPWVVTLEALAPYRVPAPTRDAGDVPVSAALTSAKHKAQGGISISLQVLLQTAAMKKCGMDPVVISQPKFDDQYWTLTQMLTHHASNGCGLHAGDLLSSGTVSGPERKDAGCMVEITGLGKEPLQLPSGETRVFLEDGDTVWLRGVCERDGYKSIGFGECKGQIVGDAR